MEKKSAFSTDNGKEKNFSAVAVLETKKKITGSEVIVGQLTPKRTAEGGEK